MQQAIKRSVTPDRINRELWLRHLQRRLSAFESVINRIVETEDLKEREDLFKRNVKSLIRLLNLLDTILFR